MIKQDKTVYDELGDVMIMPPPPVLPNLTDPEWAVVRYGLGDDSNKQQLRGKRQICNNLLLYESDVMQGVAACAVSISLVVQSMVAQVW